MPYHALDKMNLSFEIKIVKDFYFYLNLHKYITIKHDLEIITEEHYFFDINQNPEIVISLENRGLFDQQLGNITISIQVYSKTSEIGTYFRTPNLLSGEQQNLNFAFGNLEAGNYYCVLDIILINEKIYSQYRSGHS